MNVKTLLNNYTKTVKHFVEYLGLDRSAEIEDFTAFPFIYNDYDVSWIMNDDVYSSEIKDNQVIKKDGYLVFLMEDDFGGSARFGIFDLANLKTDEEWEEWE